MSLMRPERFEWFVAWRYLFTRERKALVSIITLISIAGVAVGVAALITVISVMDGVDVVIFRKIADLYPHVRVVTPDSTVPVDEGVLARLREDPRVRRADPALNKKTLLRGQTQMGEGAPPRLIQLIGAEKVGKGSVYQLHESMADETFDVAPGTILVGAPLGMQGGAMPGSTATLTALNPIQTAKGPAFKHLQLPVSFLFSTGYYEFDENTAFVHPDTLRELWRLKGAGADYVHVQLKNPFRAGAFAEELKLGLPEGWKVTTWQDENSEFFSALMKEKLALFLILMLVIIVAAFNIIGTLILMVLEKTREIGIMKAMGATGKQIARIFLLDGILIGVVGTIVGMGLGLLICWLIPMYELPIPTQVYNINHLPVRIEPLTVAVVMASAFVICTLAGLFPARQAARLDPVESLRFK